MFKKVTIVSGIVVSGLLLSGCTHNDGKLGNGAQTQTFRQATEDALESKTKINVPEEGEKIELLAQGGVDGMGIARKIKNEGKTTVEVVANLLAPTSGKYEAWLVDNTGKQLPLGTLYVMKGGYFVEKVFETNIDEYKKVVVGQILESGLTEKKVLEGSF